RHEQHRSHCHRLHPSLCFCRLSRLTVDFGSSRSRMRQRRGDARARHSATAERVASEFISVSLMRELGSTIAGAGLTIFTNLVECMRRETSLFVPPAVARAEWLAWAQIEGGRNASIQRRYLCLRSRRPENDGRCLR